MYYNSLDTGEHEIHVHVDQVLQTVEQAIYTLRDFEEKIFKISVIKNAVMLAY